MVAISHDPHYKCRVWQSEEKASYNFNIKKVSRHPLYNLVTGNWLGHETNRRSVPLLPIRPFIMHTY